jgi:hypothetical protein
MHAAVGVVAVVLLALPAPALGWRVALVVVAYHVAFLAVARTAAGAGWGTAYAVLAPLSVLMVLPDWFLSAELGTLRFADTGAWFVGTVPVVMAGMWVLALFPLVLTGAAVERRSGPAAAAGTVAVAGLALFLAAERLAPLVPLWEPVGVPLVAGVATYVLLPEVVLSVAAWWLVRGAASRPRILTAVGVVLLPATYLGLLAIGVLLLV